MRSGERWDIPGNPRTGDMFALIGRSRGGRDRAENSNEIGTDGDLQYDRSVAVAHSIGEPPHRALAHAPGQLLAGEQKRGDLAQCRLMADDEYRFAAVGPAGGSEHRLHRRTWPELRHDPELALERERSLLRAIGRAHQDARRIGQMTVEPACNALCLLAALGGQSPSEIGLASLRFGMAPENEVHPNRLIQNPSWPRSGF